MIRDNIKRICNEKGMTISYLEEKADISKGYIYNMKNPSINLLNRIAGVLNVEVCDLIADSEKET